MQTFFLRSVLMIEDLPVFGYPMKPTEICFRLLWSDENCLSVLIRLPFPKELVKDAWNARHGWSRLRSFTQRACIHSQQVFREKLKTLQVRMGMCVSLLSCPSGMIRIATQTRQRCPTL